MKSVSGSISDSISFSNALLNFLFIDTSPFFIPDNNYFLSDFIGDSNEEISSKFLLSKI
jgi:hypothetical protein